MRRRLWTSLTAALLLGGAAGGFAHDARPVIVDTDMALDDARALALLLASPGIEVLAIVTSDGVSAPATGATNACRILHFLRKDGLPVGVGRAVAAPPPPWRARTEALAWAQLATPKLPAGGLRDATSVIRAALRAEPDPVHYVCLGPLSNLADALRGQPELAERIESVLWCGTPPTAAKPDWNAERDLDALKTVSAMKLKVEALHLTDAETPAFDAALLAELQQIDSPAAKLITRLHRGDTVMELVRTEHLRLWDDVVVLRALGSPVIRVRPVAGASGWFQLHPLDPRAVRTALAAAAHPVPARDMVVLTAFPTDPALLQPDMRDWARQILSRYGAEEWKATVLTSELHRHLGTFSIVGAKMGLRARERLDAGLDELHVESRAGLKPPLSCVNDGLQVATGASLGRGTITVTTPESPQCEAIFSRGGQRLHLRLKREFAQRIASDLAELVRRHGGVTPAYFKDVRTSSMRHWLELDRNTIFEEIETAPHPLR